LRSFLLILVSNILSNIDGGKPRPVLQLINVLSQIGLGYFLCFLITRMRFSLQVFSALLMLFGYWTLFVFFPGPAGPFSKTGNIGDVIDLKWLGYNYPDGYVSINFLDNATTILFGCWAGMLLQSKKPDKHKLKILLGCAAAALVIGLALEPVNPMVKRLWSASFTFYSAGWVIFMLAAFFWLVEVRQYRRWMLPMTVLGMNSMFMYCLWHSLGGWVNDSIGEFTGRFWYLGDFGAIPQRLSRSASCGTSVIGCISERFS